MYVKFRATYDSNHDSFRIEFLLIPCAVLALVINHEFTVLEVSPCVTFVNEKLIASFSGDVDILDLLGIGRHFTPTVYG